MDLGYQKQSTVIPKSMEWKAYHQTAKSGPNGQALYTSLIDFQILPEKLLKNIKILGGPTLSEKMDTLSELLKTVPELGHLILTRVSSILNPRIRKISFFGDKELKVRVIAQLDYFSQTALRPLHSYLFRALKKIPQDRTFDQGGGFQKLLSSETKDKFYSVDLTAATDRFPIQFISWVLRGRLPDSYVDA